MDTGSFYSVQKKIRTRLKSRTCSPTEVFFERRTGDSVENPTACCDNSFNVSSGSELGALSHFRMRLIVTTPPSTSFRGGLPARTPVCYFNLTTEEGHDQIVAVQEGSYTFSVEQESVVLTRRSKTRMEENFQPQIGADSGMGSSRPRMKNLYQSVKSEVYSYPLHWKCGRTRQQPLNN